MEYSTNRTFAERSFHRAEFSLNKVLAKRNFSLTEFFPNVIFAARNFLRNDVSQEWGFTIGIFTERNLPHTEFSQNKISTNLNLSRTQFSLKGTFADYNSCWMESSPHGFLPNGSSAEWNICCTEVGRTNFKLPKFSPKPSYIVSHDQILHKLKLELSCWGSIEEGI